LYHHFRSYRHVDLFRESMGQGDYETALATIQTTLNLNPYAGYSYLQQAQVYIKLRNYEAALHSYNQALRYARAGDEASIYAGRSSVYICLEKYDKALIDANHAIACDRHAWYAYVARGHTYLGLNHLKIALEDFEQARQLSIETKAPICYGLALTLYNLEDYQTARNWAQQAAALDSENAEASTLLGGILIGCGQFEEASQRLELALNLNPELARIYFQRGRLYMAQARYSEAISELTKSTKMRQPRKERQEAQNLLATALRHQQL
jgi:tetratricopeptide (TPR) repeat protein